MVKIELNEGIIKSFDSAFATNNHAKDNPLPQQFIITYRDKPLRKSGSLDLLIFKSENKAKKEIVFFVQQTFWHGEYWQSYKDNIKAYSNFDVDFSETIKILPSNGKTSRFDLPENKKMFKYLANELQKKGIMKIMPLKVSW